MVVNTRLTYVHISVLKIEIYIHGSFSEARGHIVGFYAKGVIKTVRHLSFKCHLSAKIQVLFVNLSETYTGKQCKFAEVGKIFVLILF